MVTKLCWTLVLFFLDHFESLWIIVISVIHFYDSFCMPLDQLLLLLSIDICLLIMTAIDLAALALAV